MEVTGWTSSDNPAYEDWFDLSDVNDLEAKELIVKEVRKKGYKFN